MFRPRTAAAAVALAFAAAALPAADAQATSTVRWASDAITNVTVTGVRGHAFVDTDNMRGDVIPQVFRDAALTSRVWQDVKPTSLGGPGTNDVTWTPNQLTPDTTYYTRLCFDQEGDEPRRCGTALTFRTRIPTTHDVRSFQAFPGAADGAPSLKFVGLLVGLQARGTMVFESGPQLSSITTHRYTAPVAEPGRGPTKLVSSTATPPEPVGFWRACFEWRNSNGTQGRQCGEAKAYDMAPPCHVYDNRITPAAATSEGAVMNGTAAVDLMFGGTGNDTIRGLDGGDCVKGADGDDTLSGDAKTSASPGRDWVYGGNGNDSINVANDDPGDRVYCGPGEDEATVDQGDVAIDCEHMVFTDTTPPI